MVIYRSTQSITKIANSIFETNRNNANYPCNWLFLDKTPIFFIKVLCFNSITVPSSGRERLIMRVTLPSSPF